MSNKNTEGTTDAEGQNGLGLVIEYINENAARILANDQLVHEGQSSLMRLGSAVCGALRDEDLPKTRLIVTGNLVSSVNDREDRTANPFTVERGAGTVAAKTMPPNTDGVVDILVPIDWVLPVDDAQALKERNEYIEHIAAHEAIHASLFHIGNKPFDLMYRGNFGDAMRNFLSMAGKQIEEHLAEFLGSKTTGRKLGQSAGQVKASIEAWQETIKTKLPAIPESSPDYFQRGMMTSFESLHILWKSLAYLAASLRTDDGFEAVPSEITNMPEWQEFIAPWWPKHVELLGRIPMTVELDPQATDEVVHEMGLFLQNWADSIGFDFHDTDQGAYFRVKIWD